MHKRIRQLLLASTLASGLAYGQMDMWPRNSTLELGSTRQFGAYVPLSPNTVYWSVNDIVGGNAMLGTISAAGLYTPPAVAPTPNTLTIKATSTAFADKFTSTTLKVTRKYPWLWSIAPSQLRTGNFEVSFNGANFAPDSQALLNGMPVTTVYHSPTKIVAKGTIATTGNVTFSVRQPDPGGVTGNTVTASVASAPVSVTILPGSATIQAGASVQFTANVSGNAYTAVTWALTGAGTLLNGLYTAPASVQTATTAAIRATSVASPSTFAQATVTINPAPSNPPPGNPPPTATPALLTAGRFLEQASFGPTPATLAKVQQMGINAYLDEQFSLPETQIPTPAGNSMGDLRRWMLSNYSTANDQLRQRAAYSLGQIVVTSGSKLVYADEIVPWLKLLSKHAFGNYKDFLKEITMSPSMGKYLDAANSLKAGNGSAPNENYPRELLQLFTIGLYQLNMDGSFPNNQQIPTYDQATVQQVSRALTGWTYATAPGAEPRATNWEYFGAPMETREGNHDTGAKSFLGCTLPAGQTVIQDTDATLNCLFNHPNVPPFIATRLIRSMVASNPSAAFIQRIANVFANNGSGVRGDLKAVIRAILTDPEARQDTPTPNSGRLKEPILHTIGFLRALNGYFPPTQQLTYLYDNMAQSVLNPPSVFNWFSPLYRVPKSTLFGPEFQIYTPTEATLRGNLFHHFLGQNGGGDFVIDLSPFQPYGNDMPGLLEAANAIFLYGRMTPEMKTVLINAATPGYDANQRIQTVVYLTALSGQYAVQH